MHNFAQHFENGKYWITEFGNPDVKEEAAFLRKYSPYHNITDREYPKTLVWSLLNDDRVHPAHAIKFHMRLSEHTDGAFLRIGMSGGHSGMTPKEAIQLNSDLYGFVADCLNASG